jgi:CDP-diacylglycerol--glycerol-3-phosphate 3-phosphatidyltransferase/cardiolipin synthase
MGFRDAGHFLWPAPKEAKLSRVFPLGTPFILGYYSAALVLFCAASVTDFFDGKIARERNLITNFGKIMDPLADKILVYSALCLFIEADIIRAWMLILILAREFIVSGMRTVAASEGRVLAAGMSGKIKTVLQMFAVIVFLLALCLTKTQATVMLAGNVLFYASLVMTVYSGAEYVLKNRDVFSM